MISRKIWGTEKKIWIFHTVRSYHFTNKRIFLENLTKSCIFHKVWSWINPLDMQMVTGFANLLNARKLEFIKVCNSTQWLLEERNRKKTRIENFILQLFSKIFNVISRKWLWGLLKLVCAHLVPIFRESGIWIHEFRCIIRFHVIFWLPELASLKVDIRCGSGSEMKKNANCNWEWTSNGIEKLLLIYKLNLVISRFYYRTQCPSFHEKMLSILWLSFHGGRCYHLICWQFRIMFFCMVREGTMYYSLYRGCKKRPLYSIML